jgi:glycosyltransferase involved in cell wall biosynthesis
VIVVDQSDITHDFCSSNFNFDLKIIRSDIKNASLARNLGASHSNGDFLWFLDDDATVLSFPDLSVQDEKKVRFIEWYEKSVVFKSVYPIRKLNIVRRSGTPFYLVPRTYFDLVGGFDKCLGPGTEVKGGEDLDLLIRVNSYQRIDDFRNIGCISHHIDNDYTPKSYSYFYARGYVLIKNREYVLFVLNLIYDLSRFRRFGLTRFFYSLRGGIGYLGES